MGDGYWDDVNGGWLPAALVCEARREEIRWDHQHGLWEKKPNEGCWGNTGRAPISLRWVDTNKGSDDKPIVRSRLVAREMKARTKELTAREVFSAMPPLEGMKLLCSLLVSLKRSRSGGSSKMGSHNISRATCMALETLPKVGRTTTASTSSRTESQAPWCSAAPAATSEFLCMEATSKFLQTGRASSSSSRCWAPRTPTRGSAGT